MRCFVPGGQRLNGELIGGGQHCFDALGGGQRLAPHGQHPGDRHHGVEDDGKISKKRGDDTRAAQAGIHPVGAHQHHQHQAQIQRQVHGGLAESHHHIGPVLVPHDLTVDALKALLFPLAAGQGLDDPDAGGVFPHHPHHFVHRPLQAVEQGDGPPGHQIHDAQNHRQHTGEHQRQHRVQGDGHRHAAHHQDGRTDADALHHAHHPVNVIGVSGHAGDQAGHGKAVDLPVGQIGDLPKQVVAQSSRGLAGHPGRHPVSDNIAGDGQKGARQHHKPPPDHQAHVLQRGDVIDDVRQDIGQQQVHDGAQQLDGQAQAHPFEIGPHIPDDQVQESSPSFLRRASSSQ